ncbi:MAG: undecaprenyl/decaprenyl-phosphate alpha-N-acetylglucosaminyl 1-phosphate transferase [Phycisphaerae bacterium]|nr:undecaprenyl/decaprenyl-phosphate alpha-N-acetylglucosaminyl 1-phosphate transferase [Phycisphaerae bacterium]
MSRAVFLLILLGTSAAIPFAISATATAIIRRWALRRGFVDHPGGHKAHAKPIALGGGIGITAALVLPLAGAILVGVLASRLAPETVRHHQIVIDGRNAEVGDLLGGMAMRLPMGLAILGGALVLHALGLLDDIRPLGPLVKMLVMTGVALVLTAGYGIRSLDMLGPIPATLASVLWIVVLTNAFNFLDNMDGLSAGVAAVAAVIFGIAAVLAGQVFVPALAFMLVGALMGFLLFNFPPASIFMGDSGSLVVGYFLAVLTILTAYRVDPELGEPFGLLAPLVVMAVPLYDMVSVVFIRLRAGVSPFRGDRHHFSHRLVRRGLRPQSAVLTIYLATGATGLSSLLLPQCTWPFALVVLLQCFFIVLIVAILESTGTRPPSENS